MAKVNIDDKSIEESCGFVTFQLIERVKLIELKDIETFAHLLCGASNGLCFIV